MKVSGMFLFDEKRGLRDRRIANEGVPAGRRERRMETERRQTRICEISFSEWASHFVEFRKRATARQETSTAENSPDAASATGINRPLSSNP